MAREVEIAACIFSDEWVCAMYASHGLQSEAGHTLGLTIRSIS